MNRVRQVMAGFSEKYMGVRLSITSWRHIAIAIARRHLGERSKSTFNKSKEDDEDDIDDQAVDLQAGHGTHMAGLIYTQAMFQNSNSTELIQERFREASTS